jgi:hypothetical protein
MLPLLKLAEGEQATRWTKKSTEVFDGKHIVSPYLFSLLESLKTAVLKKLIKEHDTN